MSSDTPRNNSPATVKSPSKKTQRKSFNDGTSRRRPLATTDQPDLPRPLTQAGTSASGSVSFHIHRVSESAISDGGSSERLSQPSPHSTATGRTKSSPFFKLRRSKKQPTPFFDLSHLPQKDKPNLAASSTTSLNRLSTPRPSSSHSPDTPRDSREKSFQSQRPPLGSVLLASSRNRSGQSSPTRATLLRGRSSTMSSLRRESGDDHLLPPVTRTSSSTGRRSFGDLLGLTRLRQNSELSRQGSLTPATPASLTSKSNSLQLMRESIPLPERREDESAGKYLARVEQIMHRGAIGAAMAKGADPFSTSVLRSFMRSFSFFGDPMDMAIRKLLMEAELPKETQHIDRFLQAFSNRYHECNPGIFSSPDQAYFIAFSLLILHTDVFNKNNKHKMQKHDYIKNTREEGVYDDVLECFYDNISYTPFIHVEDDANSNGGRLSSHDNKRKRLHDSTEGDPAKKAAKEPLDPYTLIIDGNLDALRPNLKEAMYLEDHYTYLGTAAGLNLKDLQKTFFRTGVLQIVSARSRPDAFMSDKTVSNPAEAHRGIVDIKVTKVGLLWRKEAKKRKARSPWQEWGAILTGAQLYFFRNVSWVKNLMHQYESHLKAGNDDIPITFHPPLEVFKPDDLMTTQGAVALYDTTYKKHKNAFVYVRSGDLDEVLLANSEDELNDWIAKLNYAAAFRTSGVKMRGVGGNYDNPGRRTLRRLENSEPPHLIQTPTGPVSIVRSRVDKQMAEDIQTARWDVMRQKIDEANRNLETAQKGLDEVLRNARHLQILAPIQPKSREQLSTIAARMAMELKWNRINIWKERCHRDILVQDLAEDASEPESSLTPTKKLSNGDAAILPRPTSTRTDGRSSQYTASEQNLHSLKDEYSLGPIPSASDIAHEVEASLDLVFNTPPPSSGRSINEPRDLSVIRSTSGHIRKQSSTSITASPATILYAGSPQKLEAPYEVERTSSEKSERDHDDVDAQERAFLRQSGLVETKKTRSGTERTLTTTSAEGTEPASATDRERMDKNKIRRSIHRTLREGAGHLSHHRSKKGKEAPPSGTPDDGAENTLARGTGSFMVHGKKASVIRLGTELQNMSQEDKNTSRRQAQQVEQAALSPLSLDEDDDFVSAVSVPVETSGSDRRESAASASTATARSFRELHRKYSSAQAARSVSTGGRLTVPSDGESEAAVSFSDGRRSPLPPIETELHEEEEDFPGGSDDGDREGHEIRVNQLGGPATPARQHEEVEVFENGDERAKEKDNYKEGGATSQNIDTESSTEEDDEST